MPLSRTYRITPQLQTSQAAPQHACVKRRLLALSDGLFWHTSGSLLPIGRSLLRCLQAPVTEGRLRPRHVSFAMGLFCCVGRPLLPIGRSLLGYLQAPVTEGRLRPRHTDTLYYCLYYTVFTTYLQAPVTKGRLRRRHTVLGQLVFQKAARPLVLETVAARIAEGCVCRANSQKSVSEYIYHMKTLWKRLLRMCACTNSAWMCRLASHV